MASETRRDIADKVVREWADAYQVTQAGPGTKARLAYAIEAALKARDERAAKIAESHTAADCDGPDCGVVIAAAIRNEDADAE